MWKGTWRTPASHQWTIRAVRRPRRPCAHEPAVDALEVRQLLTAALAPIPNLSVPSLLGAQVSLDGSGSGDPSQTFTASSSNPDIQVSVAQGTFWTITVSHSPANVSDVTINNESMTFQLFGDLTPLTVARITTLTNDHYFTTATLPGSVPAGPGKYIPRITSDASTGFSVIQGGSGSPTSTASSSGLPPIATEPVQQLAFTGVYQIGMANTGQPNSTDAQFFISTGTFTPAIQQTLDFNYTIFGQLVSGQQTLADLSHVAVQTNSFGELSQPITPVTIAAVTLSSTSPSGVLHIDATQARAGETATVTVTAKDPTDGTQVTRTFDVAVGSYNGPADPAINFRPFASPVTVTTSENQAGSVHLAGQSGYPDPSQPGTLSYTILTQPAHGTLSQFDAATGRLVYTPDPDYSGTDSFEYQVTATGPLAAPATTVSNPAVVTIAVQPAAVFPVAVTGVSDVVNARNLVTQITVDFSGPLNASQAVKRCYYRLAIASPSGSFSGKYARVVLLRKPVYSAGGYVVTLRPGRPFTLARPVQLLIRGNPPHALRDSRGVPIDGNHDGKPGGNAIVVLSSSGATIG